MSCHQDKNQRIQWVRIQLKALKSRTSSKDSVRISFLALNAAICKSKILIFVIHQTLLYISHVPEDIKLDLHSVVSPFCQPDHVYFVNNIVHNWWYLRYNPDNPDSIFSTSLPSILP
jgi:hypothetical protein